MTKLENFRLFPSVFSIPAKAVSEVGTSYCKDGIQLMQAANQLLDEWQPQVILS